MRSESGSIKCARVKVTFKNAIKCFPYHVPKPREPFGGLRAGRLTISPTGPSDASPIACSLTYLPEHPLTAPAPGTGRATAASHWMKAKRCVQANLWQGSLSAVAGEARRRSGIVAGYVSATTPANAATGRPGCAGFAANGSTQYGAAEYEGQSAELLAHNPETEGLR